MTSLIGITITCFVKSNTSLRKSEYNRFEECKTLQRFFFTVQGYLNQTFAKLVVKAGKGVPNG
jgi:hypothetical protein